MSELNITCEDNMALMARYPDNYFDLAIVDPPYGIGEDGGDKKRSRGRTPVVSFKKKNWDSSIPNEDYFKELTRVSKNRIIWGANYMVHHLPPSMGWVFWEKGIAGDFSDGELAYTSFSRALRKVYVHYQDDYNGKWREKIHPTQKPVALYKWLLDKYAKPGDKILDTHLGSGSIAIACHDYGFDLTACELDPDYYAAAMKRIEQHTSQQSLFNTAV